MTRTDAPACKAKRASFLESDRFRTLDLPQDRRLPSIAKSIEVMRCEASGDVRRLCAQFPSAASEFYQVPSCARYQAAERKQPCGCQSKAR